MEFILLYWRQILYAVCAASVAILLYWYGYHIPNKLKITQEALQQANVEIERGKEAVKLLDEIQKGKAKIDDQTFKNISTIRAKIGKPHTVLIPYGRLLLPTMR